MIIDLNIERYLTRTWYTKRLKRLKKKQWVGQPFAIQASKVTLDPQVRAANWLCDSLEHGGRGYSSPRRGFYWRATKAKWSSRSLARPAWVEKANAAEAVSIIEQAEGLGWLEQTGDSHIDWRELWADELSAHEQFAWLLIHVGPEGLYQAAKLSEGEAEVMRLKQEGHTQDQVAFISGKELGTVKKMLSRGYAKIARQFQLPSRPIRLNRVVNTLAGISRRKKSNPQILLDLPAYSKENLLREAA